MTNKDSNKKSIFVETITQIIPILSSILLVSSLTYDYSFLWAIGLSFNDIPSSITEHIRSAILWSPAAFLYLAFILLFELIIRLSFDGLTEEEILNKKYSPTQLRKSKKIQNYVLYGMFIVVAMFSTFTATDQSWMYILFMAIYGFIFGIVSTNENMEKLLNTPISRVLVIAPFFFAMLGFSGFNSGKELLNSKKIIWELSISQNDEVSTLKFIGLRRFSEFTIAVAANQNISVLPNESILNAQMIKPLEPKITNACKWFNITCEVAKK